MSAIKSSSSRRCRRQRSLSHDGSIPTVASNGCIAWWASEPTSWCSIKITALIWSATLRLDYDLKIVRYTVQASYVDPHTTCTVVKFVFVCCSIISLSLQRNLSGSHESPNSMSVGWIWLIFPQLNCRDVLSHSSKVDHPIILWCNLFQRKFNFEISSVFEFIMLIFK